MAEYREFSEKTLDDAITAACQSFSVTSDRLDYVIVDQGSAGFLGFNARKAVIKARIKGEQEAAVAGTVEKTAPVKEEKKNHVLTMEEIEAKAEAAAAARANGELPEVVREDSYDRRDRFDRKRGNGRDRSGKGRGQRGGNDRRRDRRNDRFDDSRDFETVSKKHEEEIAAAALARENAQKKREQEVRINYTDEQIAAITERSVAFLKSVFEAMHMDVNINTDFDKEENVLLLDFSGDDMGVLIGKRGQTLDSIQYLVSLVANKDVEGYVHVKADTENYRERRKKTLENLAKNIAYRVRKSRRSVALEPMNPYERRIIHSALQNDKYVTTYSEGEDPFRKVVVTLKK